MKKIIAILFIITLGFGSCNEDLTPDPVNSYLIDNFYSTDAQVYAALVAAYDPVGWSMAFGNWISYVMYGEIRSDNANAGGDPSDGDQPGWQEIDDLRETNTNTITLPMYRRNYIGIYRANLVLLQPEFTSDLVTRYQAEAKFLRAYYHFELFKHFGPIPVITRIVDPENTVDSRSTMDDVFTQITNDLKEAADVLPTTLSSDEIGRASRGAALALLGKAYLYWADMDNDNTEKFALAADYLQEVVESGAYQLEDDYAQLFAVGLENPAESVFEVQHSNLYQSDWSWFEGIEGNGIIQLCGVRGLCTDHPLYQPGWGFMLPTQALVDSYLSDDEYRMDASIISVAEIEADCDGVDPSESNPLDYTGFWQQKFANYNAYAGNNVNGGDPNLTKNANTYIIRYADVLLMLAEALHRSGGSDAEAMQYIDLVRERAAGPGDNTGSFRTAQDLMEDEGWSLLEVIWYERRAEFAMEGDRWYDLVRSGRATADLFPSGDLRRSNFNENSIWLPIAFDETVLAPNITTYPDASLFN